MNVDEHRDLAAVCREHGYPEIAEYHERRVRELERRKP